MSTVNYWNTAVSLNGSFVKLVPYDASKHLYGLWKAQDPSVWTYINIPQGFEDGTLTVDELRTFYEGLHIGQGFMGFVVLDKRRNDEVIGIYHLMDIVPVHKTIEIGHVWITKSARGGPAGPETVLLLLHHCFERLKCNRVTWKCDANNLPSRRAAERQAAVFEGILRHHYTYQRSGRRRSTAYYSWVNEEWPAAEPKLQALVRTSAEKPSTSWSQVKAKL